MCKPQSSMSASHRLTFPFNETLHRADGEDMFHTRIKHVLIPIKANEPKALLVTVPFYGNLDVKESKKLVENGAINRLARAI